MFIMLNKLWKGRVIMQSLILIDKAEVIFFVPTKNKPKRYSLMASDINRIQFDKCVTKSLFGLIKKETESINVFAGKLGAPIVYIKDEHKKLFDEYKRDLEEYAKKNYITFADNTKE